MALTNWAFIYTAGGAAADGEITVADTGTCRTVLVGVERPEQAVAVARRLVDDEHVELIELCGGFGPVWTARILAEIDHAVPVGSVAYGPESVDGVHAIFS